MAVYKQLVRVCENGDIESSSNEVQVCELCGSTKWELRWEEWEISEDQAS